MMSRAGKVVVVSGTVVSGTVVSTAGGAVSGNVESSSASELVTSSEVLEALGVLLTAQADNAVKPSAIYSGIKQTNDRFIRNTKFAQGFICNDQHFAWSQRRNMLAQLATTA